MFNVLKQFPLSFLSGLKFLFYIKKKNVWYDCQGDNYPQKTKMTQTITTIGHRTAFNNEQSPYRIVSYNRPRYDNVKEFKQEN